MISIRNITDSDYIAIASFFNNKKELQYSFSKINYPVILDQIKSIIDSRSNQIILVENDIPIGFVDLYNNFNFKPVELIIREFDNIKIPVLKLKLIAD